jgi:ribosomal protein S18 acetylase RimI-like enzyme
MLRWIPQVEICPPEEREEALEVLYQHIPESLRGHLVSEVLLEDASGQLDLSGLWVAREQTWSFGSKNSNGKIIGALLTQALAGQAAALWAPQVRPSFRRAAIAAALVRAALAYLQSQGFRVVQAVLDESDSHRGGADLARGGMRRVTELLYLERDTKTPLPKVSGEPATLLQWHSFTPAHEAKFRTLLESTYNSSLDMPELAGVRSLDDVIAGHRATGRFVPDRWQYGEVQGQPDAVAILLLAEIPDRSVWEIVYLGLTPPARGRGLGRAAIAHALEMARPQASRLELAVDIRNHPATRLYEATGFYPFDRRAVHLAVFPENRGRVSKPVPDPSKER